MSSFSGSQKQWGVVERSLVPQPGPLSQEKRIRLGGKTPRWTLIVGPRSLNVSMLGDIARMGEDGPVRVLDGGNRFNAYVVARGSRRAARDIEPHYRVTSLHLLPGASPVGEHPRHPGCLIPRSARFRRALPFEVFLLCMLLEEHKQVMRLREKVEELGRRDGEKKI